MEVANGEGAGFGPAADMSISSRGHFVQLEDGKFVRSTVIVVPTQTAETLEEVKQQRKKLEDGAQDRGATDAQGNAEDATLDISGNPAEAQQDTSAFLEVDLNEVLMENEQHPPKEDGEKKKRVRLHKKSPPATFYPELQQGAEERPTSLCSLQGRGEWHLDGLQQDHLQEMEVWQHRELKKQLQECWSNWLEGVGTTEQGKERLQDMEQFKSEIETLEKVLETKREEEQIRMKSLAAHVEKEVLQTRVVSMEEVRANPEEWREAFKKEYEVLTAGPVLPISQQEFEEMVKKNVDMEVLPMKGVATLKPPNRHKARIVVCGNYSTNVPEADVSVGGVCATTIRAAAHVAISRGWQMGSIDVASAFLQAPRRDRSKVVITEPPSILRTLNIIPQGERWKVCSALYGMIDSPADWASYRDQDLAKMRWAEGNKTFRLEQTMEKHLWEVKCNQNEVVRR